MHWGLGQGHEAILQRFYDVNLVVLKPTDQDMLIGGPSGCSSD